MGSWQIRGCGPGKGEGVVLVLEKGAPCRCEGVVLADERVQFLPRKGGGFGKKACS